MDLNRYRIYRTDSRNIAIQRQEPRGVWVTVSYHGNSPRSLVSGLFELVSRFNTPEAVKLSEQLKNLELEQIRSEERIRRLIDKSLMK